jgi:hypothetical protein
MGQFLPSQDSLVAAVMKVPPPPPGELAEEDSSQQRHCLRIAADKNGVRSIHVEHVI